MIDGDGALAEALRRARARGVRGLILPMYFIDARDTREFAGHKLSEDATMVLEGQSAVLNRRNPLRSEEHTS